MDIFALANNNIETLSKECEDTVKGLANEQLQLAKEFKEWVKKNAQISINLSPFVVSLMLEDAPYQNIHEVARRFAESTGESVDEVLRLFLKHRRNYYEQRMAFDKKFAGAKSFRYGALNGGCTGVIWYGTICGVLKQDFVAGLENCVCLPDDSLAMCHATGQFDPSDLCEQIAPYSLRHFLATQHRVTELSDTDREEWPELLISNPENPDKSLKQRYFEIIFIGEVSLGSFGFFRLSDVYYDDQIHLPTVLSNGTPFRWKEEQQKLIDRFQLMLKKHIIHLKPTEELALIYYFKHWLKNARTDDEMLDSLRHLPNIQCTEARQWLEEFLKMRNHDANKVAHEQLAQADDYMRINQAIKDKKIEVL